MRSSESLDHLTHRRMHSREYTDRGGTAWQVFEVQRSAPTVAVTAGRELGWLTFVCENEKRRLAPPPADWNTATPAQLEELCDRATPVNRGGREALAAISHPRMGSTDARRAPRSEAELLSIELRDRIRSEAQAARAMKLPAVQAMMQVRALLQTEGIGIQSPELRAARKLFLDVFYFEPHS